MPGSVRGVTLKPLDVVIRDRIAPGLVPAGFKRKGRLFTLENEVGDRACVDVRSFPLGLHDAEFNIDLHIQPRIWRDFLTRDGDTIFGLWQSRLGPSGGQAGAGRDLWSIDLEDEAAGSHLSATLAVALPWFLHYLDADNLLAYARNPTDPISKVGSSPETLIPMLLAARGASEELEQRLASLAAEVPDKRRGFDTPGFAAFLRAWMADHTPKETT